MSKHIFHQTLTDNHYEVQIGWDKPMQQYYGVVLEWVEDPDCDGGGYTDIVVWSNLYEVNPMPLDTIETKILTFGFTIPEGLLENVQSDRRRDAVNERTLYSGDYDKPKRLNNHVPHSGIFIIEPE